MAKSLRSKWRRKCRAVKRERYAAKELVRLKKTLGIDDDASKDVDMADVAEIATGKIIDAVEIANCGFVRNYNNYKIILSFFLFPIVVDAKKIKENTKAKQNTTVASENEVQVDGAKIHNKTAVANEDQMEVEGVRKYNKKTLLDQYGNYPVWMSLRKIQKYKKGRAKAQKSSVKTSKRLTRRQKKVMKQKG